MYSRLEDKQYIQFVEYRMCLEVWPYGTARTVYAAVIMLLQFAVPVVVLIIIHWRICNFLKTRILQVIILSFTLRLLFLGTIYSDEKRKFSFIFDRRKEE